MKLVVPGLLLGAAVWAIAARFACDVPGIAHTEACEAEADLQWLRVADPDADARRAHARGDVSFIQIGGLVASSPHIGPITLKRCMPFARFRLLEGTSDYVLSDEHARLKSLASQYAARYNKTMFAQIDRSKRSLCRRGADWDRVLSEVTTIMTIAHPMKPDGGFEPIRHDEFERVGFQPDQKPGSTPFKIFTRDPGRLNEVLGKSCASMHRNRVEGAFQVELTRASGLVENLRVTCSGGSFASVVVSAGR